MDRATCLGSVPGNAAARSRTRNLLICLLVGIRSSYDTPQQYTVFSSFICPAAGRSPTVSPYCICIVLSLHAARVFVNSKG